MREALLEKMAGEIALSHAAGETMRKWRETFGFSQSEVATRLSVNPSVISDYESGRRKSPGIATVKRLVEALVEMDVENGGHTVSKFQSLVAPMEGILDIGEYRRSIPATEFVERIEGRAMVLSDLEERKVQGYTLIDAIKAIGSLNATDYGRIYGWSTERALVFSGIKYGRSPMVAIRVHPMKPSLVVYHQPEDVDKLAFRLAEFERIPLIITQLEKDELQARLRSLLD